MNEKQLVSKAQAGDFSAFSELIELHKGRIYSLAVKMTRNIEDSEDIVQETFLKAIDNIDQFRGEAAFGSWLYSIALNEIRRHMGKQKKEGLKPIEDYLPGIHSAEADRDSVAQLFDWKDPHSRLETDELQEIIDNSIDELPLKYREAFLLRYYEELSIKDVAHIIKVSEAATKSRILRARLALREKLSKIFEEKYGKEMPGIH